jgi:hypothetical protein
MRECWATPISGRYLTDHVAGFPSFYGDKLGHRLLWRSHEAAGFALPETDAELVVHLHIGPETDILVGNDDEAFAAILLAGWVATEPPFDIAIGRCARICDPFGNELVILDQSKAGWLLTLMVELRVSSREINKVRVAKRTATEAIKKNSASRRPPNEASPLPRWIPPQLCQLVETAPSGPQWLHEINSTVSECLLASNADGCNC